MSRNVLIFRPQPGADETAGQARSIGLKPVLAPLFAVRPLAWLAPDPAGFDAVMLTSANAARHAGTALAPYLGLPCYAVGEATAAAASEAGFRDIRTGAEDGTALLALMAARNVQAALHFCGRDRLELGHPNFAIAPVPVYAADAVQRMPAAAEAALGEGALALLHSPRAAAVFGTLVGDRRAGIDIAAISTATARAAGGGWRSVAVAPRPRGQALLELAAKLCQTAWQ